MPCLRWKSGSSVFPRCRIYSLILGAKSVHLTICRMRHSILLAESRLSRFTHQWDLYRDCYQALRKEIFEAMIGQEMKSPRWSTSLQPRWEALFDSKDFLMALISDSKLSIFSNSWLTSSSHGNSVFIKKSVPTEGSSTDDCMHGGPGRNDESADSLADGETATVTQTAADSEMIQSSVGSEPPVYSTVGGAVTGGAAMGVETVDSAVGSTVGVAWRAVLIREIKGASWSSFESNLHFLDAVEYK